MFIVIEGLDGTGKSTTAQALADALNGVFLTTPLEKFKIVRPELELIYGDESLARQLFYASTAVCSSNRVEAELKRHGCVVIDRYWLSTQVYHSWRTHGSHFLLKEVEDALIKPDLTVYLELSLADRKNRMSARMDNTDEDLQTIKAVANQNLNQLYHAYGHANSTGDWLVVNSAKSTACIVEEILEYLAVTPNV